MKTTLSINQPFKDWVNHLKQDIRSAQIKAAVRVNSELLHLYWQLGAEIIERQKEMTWGSGFLEELSRELMAEFPDMKGFSYRNIRSIKQWYLFYNEPYTIHAGKASEHLAQLPAKGPVCKSVRPHGDYLQLHILCGGPGI